MKSMRSKNIGERIHLNRERIPTYQLLFFKVMVVVVGRCVCVCGGGGGGGEVVLLSLFHNDYDEKCVRPQKP